MCLSNFLQSPPQKQLTIGEKWKFGNRFVIHEKQFAQKKTLNRIVPICMHTKEFKGELNCNRDKTRRLLFLVSNYQFGIKYYGVFKIKSQRERQDTETPLRKKHATLSNSTHFCC